MTTWRVEGAGGRRWLEATGPVWTADAETTRVVRDSAGTPVALGAGLGLYRPTGPADPLWLYLTARRLLPNPQQVTGVPPQPPAGSTAGYPADAVF